jgi:predicted permease
LPQSVVQTLILFILIFLGFIAGKARILDEAAGRSLSKLLVNFVLPGLIIDSMQRPFSMELRDEAFAVLCLSLGVYAMAFLLALLLVKAEGLSRPAAGAHAFGAVFSNCAFMGFPVMQALFGQESLFATSIFNIPFQLLAFSVGPYMLRNWGPPAPGGAKEPAGPAPRLGLGSFVNPAALAALAGFLLFVLGISLAPPLAQASRLLGAATTPLSMLLIGSILARMDLSRIAGDPRLYVTTAFRLLAFPLLVWLLLRALGLGGRLLALPVVISAMPVAANSAILAQAYGGDAKTASSLVALSTLFSLVTIPLLAALLFGI